MPRQTILIVEDDERSRRLLHDFLNASGYKIVMVETGTAAVELVNQRKPNLILLDMLLPDLSGLDVACMLKSRPDTRHIPIIAVTAYAMLADAQAAIESGCDAYLSKPIYLRDLMMVIATLRSRRRPAGARGMPAGVLPSAGTMNWTARKKALIVIAVRGGMISLRAACERYMLSEAELSQWRAAFDRDGIRGLYAKNLPRRTPSKWS
jgi:two-component system, cell cycle response regulator DivK